MDAFSELAILPRWVPYRLKWNPKREKFDKIPHTGRHGLSTADPNDWTNLSLAVETGSQYGLSGVGIVMTAGIKSGDWTLVGFDADEVSEGFRFPFESYVELSPSKKGLRSFAWVPIDWAKRFKDTECHPNYCKQVEVYFGSAPRFLTVTGDAIHDVPIARLDGKILLELEKWHLNPADKNAPVAAMLATEPGEVFKFGNLSADQRHLVDGTGTIDRSAVLHGLMIKLVDQGRKREDILATLLKTPAIWQYALDHRSMDPVKALQFLKDELVRAYLKSEKGMREALVGFNSNWRPPEPLVEEQDPDLIFPVELFDEAPGLVGDIARWIYGASYAPRKEFSYACALSMMACLIGPYCKTGSRQGKVNMYMVLVGGTGTGKNEAVDTMAMLMEATDARDCILDFPASEAALRRQLNVSCNVLLRVDEFAHKLATMDRDSSSLGRAILEAYNGARMPPKVYAESNKTLPAVDNPFVQILGCSTDKIWEVAKTNHLDDGTLNRFVFICLNDEPDYQRNFEPDATVPKDLKDRINAFWREGRFNDLIGDVEGFGRKITYTKEVMKLVMTQDKSVWELQQQTYGSLYNRFMQNAMKVATILAIASGRNEVTMLDYETARKFIKWSIANTYRKIDMFIADNNNHRLSKKLLAKLDKEKGKLRMRDVYRHMHLTKREMEDIVCMLELAGEAYRVIEMNRANQETEWLYRGQKPGDD